MRPVTPHTLLRLPFYSIPQHATMMNALRPSLFRPTTRPSSTPPTPAPQPSDGALPANRAPQSIARPPLPGFKSVIPPQSVAWSRVATVIQDATYLQDLSLKFSEGICKTLGQPVGHATATGPLDGRLHSNRLRTRVRITYCSVSGSFSGIMLLIISTLADRLRVECPTPLQGGP